MRINITGTESSDTLFATDTIGETLKGKGGDDVFVFYDGAVPYFDRDFSDRFLGGSGDDVMTGLYVGFNEYTAYSQLSFDGGKGYDTVAYNVSGTVSNGDDIVIELDKFETLERSVEAHAFDITALVDDGSTADFSVIGGAGDEFVRIALVPAMLQQLESQITLTVDLGDGNDEVIFTGQQRIDTKLTISTGKGRDTIIVNDSSTENSKVSKTSIKAGGGSDLVVLEGMHKEIVKLGGGSDTVYVVTGNFSDSRDKITTGDGADRIYLELDEYSTIAKITDFDPSQDILVFDQLESRDTTVTFDKAVADAAAQPMLYMDNAAGALYFGDNLLVEFTNGAVLTDLNFTTDAFLY